MQHTVPLVEPRHRLVIVDFAEQVNREQVRGEIYFDKAVGGIYVHMPLRRSFQRYVQHYVFARLLPRVNR